MPNDLAFRVHWDAGQIVVHTGSAESAIEVALEYMRAMGTKRIVAERVEEPDAV